METKICRDCGRELPIDKFKNNRYGVKVSVCTECATRKLRENKEKKRIEKAMQAQQPALVEEEAKTALSGFTPRQLMAELYRRGYSGTLTYVQKIDIATM